MTEKKSRSQKYTNVAVLVSAVLALSAGGYWGYLATKDIIQSTAKLEGAILELGNESMALTQALRYEQQKNKNFADQIGEIAGTVGKLDKLSKTDKELLQKYSKVYFLNENYIPEDLTNIPPDYIFEKGREIKIHAKVFPFLQALVVAAAKDGADLKMVSGFRSFGDQSALKNNYTVTYGSGANKFSADQGYSEHQLGTTIDFTTAELGSGFVGFGKTLSYAWLINNAHKYGFILSYPENNSYYVYEPWHWRFVGKSLANRLHEEKQNFYSLDQRVIDNYLISIFD